MTSDLAVDVVARFARDVVTRASSDDPTSLETILPLVYDEFRTLAGQLMRWERVDHTLQPTALAHEAFLRLADQRNASLKDRQHLLALAATTMRRVLVDHARGHRAAKRGNDRDRISLSADLLPGRLDRTPDLLALEQALQKLGDELPRSARCVELVYFGGLSHEEVAEVLSISVRTVVRDWRYARAYLWKVLTDDATASDEPTSTT